MSVTICHGLKGKDIKMTKIYWIEGKNLPKNIHVINPQTHMCIAIADFNNGDVYESNNPIVIEELKKYGYKVEEVAPAVVKETLTPEQSEEKPAKPKKKKEVD